MKFYKDHIEGEGPLESPLWFVGEAPGEDEIIFKRPFIGSAGRKLDSVLERNGIDRASVRIENLCGYRPYGNDFFLLLDTPELEKDFQALRERIEKYKPVVIVALGNFPLYFLTGKGKLQKGKKKEISGIGNWRGSILPYMYDPTIKVIPTYHPSAVQRNASLYPIFDVDVKRARDDSRFREFNYPERNIIINPKGHELISIVDHYINDYSIHAVDIESIKQSREIISISFSPSPNEALVFDLTKPEYREATYKILKSENAKVFHFGIFDTTMLKLNGFEIGVDSISTSENRPWLWDTYVGSHVLEPEFPNTLAFETSLRTREPYYKDEGKDDGDTKGWSKKADRERLFRYNGKDTCCTYEVFESQLNDFDSLPANFTRTFNYSMSILKLQSHITQSGMLIDLERKELFRKALIARWAKLQYALDGIVGHEVNVRSPSLKNILYDEMKLPVRYKNKRPSVDDDALVSLIAFVKDKIDNSVRDDTKKKYFRQFIVLKAIREIRAIRQMYSMYVMSKHNEDGRSRSTYKIGPETGRWAAQKFVDGTGYNHQTNPRDPIEIEDELFEKYKDAQIEVDVEIEEEDE